VDKETRPTWNEYRQRPDVIKRVERIAKDILETDRTGIGSMDSARQRAWDAVRQTFGFESLPDELKPKPGGNKKYFEEGLEDKNTDIDKIMKIVERGDIPTNDELKKGTVTSAPSKLWIPPSAKK
jgi:hypothetical protein